MDKLKKHINSLPFKTRVSFVAAAKVFLNPGYVALAFVGVILSASLVIWSLNLDLARFILFEVDQPLGIKLQTVLWDPYWNVFTTFDSIQAFGIVLFSFLFGLNLSVITYVLKNQGLKNIPKKSSFGGTVFAVLAGGCVACGTSILAPLLTPLLGIFGVALSGTFLRELATWLNWAASILIVFSIYKLGLLAATIQSKRKLDNEHRSHKKPDSTERDSATKE